MEHKYTERMKAFESRRKAFILLSGLLLAGGMASAQVFIEGNVYGGGNIGEVTENTSVTVNNGTIGDTLKLRHRVVDQNMQLTTRVDYGNVYGGGNGYKITGHNPNNNAPCGYLYFRRTHHRHRHGQRPYRTQEDRPYQPDPC